MYEWDGHYAVLNKKKLIINRYHKVKILYTVVKVIQAVLLPPLDIYTLSHAKSLGLSATTFKEGIFLGPKIIKLVNDETTIDQKPKKVWKALKGVVKYFLGNKKDPTMKICQKYIEQISELGCKMNLKIQLWVRILPIFWKTLVQYVKSKVKDFINILKKTEKKYHRRTNVNIIVHYCWILKSRTYIKGKYAKEF